MSQCSSVDEEHWSQRSFKQSSPHLYIYIHTYTYEYKLFRYLYIGTTLGTFAIYCMIYVLIESNPCKQDSPTRGVISISKRHEAVQDPGLWKTWSAESWGPELLTDLLLQGLLCLDSTCLILRGG